MGFTLNNKLDLTKLDKSFFDMELYVGYSDTEVLQNGYTAAEMAEIQSKGNWGEWPARPHLMEGLKDGEVAIRDAITAYGQSVLGGSASSKSAQGIADVMRKSVVDYVYSGQTEPNAPYTIEKKGSDTPLIETGELLHTLETVIVKGGE